jgi:hypothetical protein
MHMLIVCDACVMYMLIIYDIKLFSEIYVC